MYKVIRWQTDGTEEVWTAPKKPTLEELYKLIDVQRLRDNLVMIKIYQKERLTCGWMKSLK